MDRVRTHRRSAFVRQVCCCPARPHGPALEHRGGIVASRLRRLLDRRAEGLGQALDHVVDAGVGRASGVRLRCRRGADAPRRRLGRAPARETRLDGSGSAAGSGAGRHRLGGRRAAQLPRRAAAGPGATRPRRRGEAQAHRAHRSRRRLLAGAAARRRSGRTRTAARSGRAPRPAPRCSGPPLRRPARPGWRGPDARRPARSLTSRPNQLGAWKPAASPSSVEGDADQIQAARGDVAVDGDLSAARVRVVRS